MFDWLFEKIIKKWKWSIYFIFCLNKKNRNEFLKNKNYEVDVIPWNFKICSVQFINIWFFFSQDT
jgi:hypothetical protein